MIGRMNIYVAFIWVEGWGGGGGGKGVVVGHGGKHGLHYSSPKT